MDVASALAQLGSPNDYDRLLAARVLAQHGSMAHRSAIEYALAHESDRWVQSALRQALDRTRRRRPRRTRDTDGITQSEHETSERDARTEAVKTVTQQLSHELSPIIGMLKYHASQELTRYESSRTKVQIVRLEGVVQSLKVLNSASSAPMIAEIDLAELIRSIAEGESTARGGKGTIPIQLAGAEPCVIQTDEGLLTLALSNGLRNALDASDLPSNVDSGPVVTIVWGSSDKEAWIAVWDEGPGLPEGSDKAFEMGTTTKSREAHSGMGLAIAQAAARSLGGSVSLRPRQEGGVAFELTLPHPLL